MEVQQRSTVEFAGSILTHFEVGTSKPPLVCVSVINIVAKKGVRLIGNVCSLIHTGHHIYWLDALKSA